MTTRAYGRDPIGPVAPEPAHAESHPASLPATVSADQADKILDGLLRRPDDRLQHFGGDGDWDPAGPGGSAPTWQPTVEITPDDTAIISPLGHINKQRFAVASPPKRGHITWRYQVTGQMGSSDEVLSKDVVHGPASTFILQPKVVGTKTVSTTLDYERPDGVHDYHRLDDVQYVTPSPSFELEKLDSISPRGKLPVLDKFQIGEELIVTLATKGVENAKTKDLDARIVGGDLSVISVVPVGTDHVEVHAKPTALGAIAPAVYVTPYDTTRIDVAPVTLHLTVEKMDDQYDYGGDGKEDAGRPSGLTDAGNHFERAMNHVFDARTRAIDGLLRQSHEKDPPIETPLWKTLAVGLCKLVLDGVTAGLGVRFADEAASVIGGIGHDALHEVVKVFAERSLHELVDAAAEGPEASAPELGLSSYFYEVQNGALSREKEAKVGKTRTSAEARAEDLERANPGDGIRQLMELTAAMNATAAAAHGEQYMKTFEAWCSLLAQTSLGAKPAAGAIAKPTELGKVLDVEQIKPWDSTVVDEDGRAPMFDKPGIAAIPGVLRITVTRKSGGDVDAKGPLFDLASTQLAGFTNQAIRDQAGKVPLKDLAIPIVVAFEDSEHMGADAWVFSRDEAGAYRVDPPDSAMLVRRAKAGGDSDAAGAARRILEVELGDTRVKPEA